MAAEPGLELIESPDGEGDTFILHQDARIHALRLGAGGCERYEIKTGRALWVQAVEGTMQVLGDESRLEVQEGDGLAIESEGVLEFKAGATGVNALIFELSSSEL